MDWFYYLNTSCTKSHISMQVTWGITLQGEALSPFLFSLFINDMENELINSKCRSYQLQMLNLFILMYADDTVLFSEDIDDLQNMLNCVQRYTDK